MYSLGQTVAKRIFIVAFMALLGVGTLAAYGQDASGQGAASDAAKPALPASSNANDSGKNVAKATELPSADVPSTHVANVRPDTYIIGVGDVLDVNVWKEPELSHPLPVRPDGMITMPLIGELKAVGLTPLQLQDQIANGLAKVMSEPQVTVMVASVNSMSFNIMGQVNRPGYYPITRPITILDAIALSGGFRDFAKQSKIYVLRTAPDGKQEQLKFNYKQVIKGKNMAQNIMLQAHDTLVIP